MRVLDWLNRLDEKTGLDRWRTKELTDERWDRWTRLWWAWLLLGVSTAILFAVMAVILEFPPVALIVPVIYGCFFSGFFYAERLRRLGRRSAVASLRRPPDSE